MDYRIIVFPVLMAFLISLLSGPVLIMILRRLRALQVERADGVETHLAKSGTPTMGGLILISVVITSLFYVREFGNCFDPFLMLGFGMVGALDDFLKLWGRSRTVWSLVDKSFFCRPWLLRSMLCICFAFRRFL